MTGSLHLSCLPIHHSNFKIDFSLPLVYFLTLLKSQLIAHSLSKPHWDPCSIISSPGRPLYPGFAFLMYLKLSACNCYETFTVPPPPSKSANNVTCLLMSVEAIHCCGQECELPCQRLRCKSWLHPPQDRKLWVVYLMLPTSVSLSA